MTASVPKQDPNTRLFQALDPKTTQLNEKQISVLAPHYIFHRLTVVYELLFFVAR